MAVTGDLNVTIYQANRQLWGGGRVRLVLLDPFANTEKKVVDHHTAARAATVLLKNVPAGKGQNYSLIATARKFRDAGVYPIKARPGGVTHTAVMLAPDDPVPDFSAFSYDRLNEFSPSFRAALETSEVTEEVLLALQPSERIAGLLNLEAKLRNTTIGERPAIEFIKKLQNNQVSGDGIRQDRIHAWVDPTLPDQLRSEMKETRSFVELPEWANELFHEGYPVSLKQRVPFASLQFSFAEEPGPEGLLAADIDIDLYTDIGHFGEVVRNHITRKKTDPYTVYVQLFDQRIFPLYVIKAGSEGGGGV